MSEGCDILVIGGGIVGLSTAMEFVRRFPRLHTVLLEKENGLAKHQSGHNSGVIHSGIYYKPGSLKARMCVAGAAEMLNFCKQNSIPHEQCGKVIVATSDEELPRLAALEERGNANGLSGLRMLGAEELRDIEPHCGGIQALHVPSTGITDYAVVSEKYAELVRNGGGEIRTGTEAKGIARRNGHVVVNTSADTVTSRCVVICAGLQSDRLSRIAGDDTDLQIVPFRGEYYDLAPDRKYLVHNLIYPVPDPRFPFLGVHFTRRVSGTVDAGPNAVLACKREGYAKTDFSLYDTVAQLTFPGFWRMARRNWRSGIGELYRSFSKNAFVRSLQRLVPEIKEGDLVPGGSGVRAQALQRNGALVDDFEFACTQSILHVFNVPSPAATASLPIGRAIVDMAAKNFDLRD
jgi:(S)-2-hydroxyglutarate dehydrogenase